MSKQYFVIANESVRQRAMQALASAPIGHVVEIKPKTRSLEQNAKLHGMLADISRQAQYIGCKRDKEFWKGLFVSGWELATGQKPVIVPGLEGEFVNIRQSTASMGSAQLSDLISYIEPWSIEHGVVFTGDAYATA